MQRKQYTERKPLRGDRKEGSNQHKGRATPKTWNTSNADLLRMTSSDPDTQERIDKCNLLCDLHGYNAAKLFELPIEKLHSIYNHKVLGIQPPKKKSNNQPRKPTGITQEDIEEHEKNFPTFKKRRLISWLNQKPDRWKSFSTVAAANRSMRRNSKKKGKK